VRIIGFVEGTRSDEPGIVGVPMILKSTAAHGHSVVLLMGGFPSLGSEKFVVSDSDGALLRKEGNGTFGIVNMRAWTHWRFCPAMLWRYSRLVREADFVTLHSLYSFPVLAGYLLARIHRKPYGIWPHGVLAPFQRQISARKKWGYNKLFGRRILEKASVIFYSAEGEREEAAALALRAPSVVIPDGFDAESFATLPRRGCFRERFLKGHTGPLILFLARLNAKKGIDLLIEAMRRVVAERPEARLAIVGPSDPPSFNNLVLQWVKEAGIESQTVIPGMANSTMRLEAYADADVFALPSHAENFGHSIFEAMACGVPVVVSETLNFAEEISRTGAGLALPRTPEAFSASIIDLIDRPVTRREMGNCGQLLARQYSLEVTGAKVAIAAQSILDRCLFPADLAPMIGASIQS